MAVAECILFVTCILTDFYHQPQAKVKQITPIVCKASKKYNIRVKYPLAIMYYETRFIHKTRSKTNDVGIMQLHCPKETRGLTCNKCDIKKLSCNIDRGMRLLYLRKKKYQSKYDKSYKWLQHYNFYSKGYARKIYSKAIASIKICKKNIDTKKIK